jgi:hypothetical protein
VRLTTLILPDYVGRLGNRLYVYIHTLAACMHWGFHCANLTMQSHAMLFENLRLNSFCRYPSPKFGMPLHQLARSFRYPIEWAVFRQKSLPSFFAKRFGVLNFHENLVERMDDESFARKARVFRWYVLWGWASRADSFLAKYQDPIGSFLKLNRKMNPSLSHELAQSSRKQNIRVCIHIRLGDRKSIPGQTFPLEFYARQAHRLSAANREKPLEFWICSDETIDLRLFPKGARMSNQRSLEEDFQIMAESHYLVGGVSTLSRAACYLGKGKIWACSSTEDIPLELGNWKSGVWALTS